MLKCYHRPIKSFLYLNWSITPHLMRESSNNLAWIVDYYAHQSKIAVNNKFKLYIKSREKNE